MQPPDTEVKTIESQVTAERLKQWKERRAKVAETSRNERLRLAEEERRSRLKKAEQEKEERVREAADRRARQLAQEKADRLEAARAKLVGRAEVDAARERLTHYRARSARAFAIRVAAFVLIPTAIVAFYLFAVATPLYRAETTLAVTAPGAAQNVQPVLGQPASASAAHQVRAILLSAATLASVDARENLSGALASESMDPLRRVRDLSFLQVSRVDQLRRYVSADARAFEGLLTISVLAPTAEGAENFATALVEKAHLDLANIPGETAASIATIVSPNASALPGSPPRIGGTILALLVFSALYAGTSIFLATLRRHAWT